MPDAYILNATPVGFGAVMSLIVEMLVSAGWTYKSSGDGLSGYNATGKVFTGSGLGAGGWGNAKSWARLAAPDGREICWQHNGINGSGTMRLKYSAAAKFIGGSPGPAVVPSATDERVLWGAGTDASPTMNSYFAMGSITGAVKYHGCAKSAAPYGFWYCCNTTPGTTIQSGLMLDPVTGVPEDPDPIVWHIGTDGAFNMSGWGHVDGQHDLNRYLAPGGVNQGCYAHRDASASAFVSWFPGAYSLGSSQQHGLASSYNYLIGRAGGAQNPFNAKYEAMPVPYMRAAVGLAFPGLKGWSTLVRWQWQARIHAIDTLDNKRWIAIGHLWLPWDGITAPSN